MEHYNKRAKVKILDYFGSIVNNSDKSQAVTEEARRSSIRATCNTCHKTISGTTRVTSNFTSHIKNSHPDVYSDYLARSGKAPSTSLSHSEEEKPMLSIASLDEPNASLVGVMPSPRPSTSPTVGNIDFFRQEPGSSHSASLNLMPRHIPTSTVQGTTDGSVRVPSMKPDPDETTSQAHELPLELGGGISSSLQHHSQTEALLNFIIGDLLSMELVNSPRFVQFLRLLNPEYRLPSLGELTRFCDFKFSLHKVQLMDELKTVSSMCVSRELWKPSDLKSVQLTIVCHYIENWRYKHMLLGSSSIDADILENNDKMAEQQKLTLNQLSIDDTNILLTVNHLNEVCPLPGFVTSDSSTESDNVSLPVEQCGYARLLDKAVIVALLSCGPELIEAINSAVILLNMPGIEWEQDVSKLETMAWFEHLGLLEMIVQAYQSNKRKLTSVDLRGYIINEHVLLISKVVEVLRPFQEVAKRVRSTNSVTCSLAFASIKLLKAALCDFQEAYSDFNLVTELSHQFQIATSQIDNDRENAYTIATILDPRFKLQWCDNEHQSYFKKSFIELVKNLKCCKPDITEEGDCKTSEPFQSGGFFTRILKQQPESLQAGTIASEVLRYLDEPLMMEDCDVMNYWQANESNFPHLSAIAERYLAIPTSYSDIKSSYHQTGELLNLNNTILSGESFHKAVQLRCKLAS